MRKPLYAIVGPTATGKSALAVELAKRHNGEILSCDSIALYKGLDIGSAKPTREEMDGIPHHLIDCVSPTERDFSVSAYRKMAIDALEGIVSRGRNCFLVGGSGLYFDALLHPFDFALPSDPAIREALQMRYADAPKAAWDALNAVDPVYASSVHPNNQKRVLRALEVYQAGGKPFSSYGEGFMPTIREEAIPYRGVCLSMDRKALYDRIDRRVDGMMEAGLEAEARTLYERGYYGYNALSAIGYKELAPYFEGQCDLFSAVDRIKQNSRRYAKRQLTWFRRETGLAWIDVGEMDRTELVLGAETLLGLNDTEE